MEYDVELINDKNVPVGRVKFYVAEFEDEEGFYFFHGSFGRLQSPEIDSENYVVVEEIVFEIWIDGADIEWGEGVDINPRKKSLTADEQNVLVKDLLLSKDLYTNNFG